MNVTSNPPIPAAAAAAAATAVGSANGLKDSCQLGQLTGLACQNKKNCYKPALATVGVS